jgi:hypothetical protein
MHNYHAIAIRAEMIYVEQHMERFVGWKNWFNLTFKTEYKDKNKTWCNFKFWSGNAQWLSSSIWIPRQHLRFLIKDEVFVTIGCPILPSILISKYLFTGSLKNRSTDNLETQKKYISMKNSQFFNYLLYAKSK